MYVFVWNDFNQIGMNEFNHFQSLESNYDDKIL